MNEILNRHKHSQPHLSVKKWFPCRAGLFVQPVFLPRAGGPCGPRATRILRRPYLVYPGAVRLHLIQRPWLIGQLPCENSRVVGVAHARQRVDAGGYRAHVPVVERARGRQRVESYGEGLVRLPRMAGQAASVGRCEQLYPGTLRPWRAFKLRNTTGDGRLNLPMLTGGSKCMWGVAASADHTTTSAAYSPRTHLLLPQHMLVPRPSRCSCAHPRHTCQC
jgi:hypothetical protein